MEQQETIVKRYVRYLKLERGLSANTLEAYQRDLEKLLAYLKRTGQHVVDVQLEDLQTFAAGLHDIGIGPRSQCRILSGVRSFYHFLMVDGYRDDDPTELLESPVLGEHLPEVLSTAEVDELEASIDLSKWEGHRNRAIIEVLFSCGLRVSELTGLKLSDLFLDDGFIRVNGKGSKERLVPISPRAVKELEWWFDDRQQMTIKAGEEDYVFLNRRGAHLTRTMILIMIKRQAEAAGIAPLVCHGPAGGRCRPARHPGHAGPRVDRDDGDIHPHRHDDAASGDSGASSAKHEESRSVTSGFPVGILKASAYFQLASSSFIMSISLSGMGKKLPKVAPPAARVTCASVMVKRMTSVLSPLLARAA